MSNGSLALPTDTFVLAERCEHAISSALNSNVDVYVWKDDWCLEIDHGVTRESAAVKQLLTEWYNEQVDPVLCEADERAYAVIPIGHDTHRFLAVAANDSGCVEHWEQITRLAQENTRLRLELESYTPQGQTDPQEAFLPSVVRQFGALSPDFSFADVAGALLPSLANGIEAQSIAVVPEAKSSRSAFIAFGDSIGDLAEWERIVGTCSQSRNGSEVYRRVCGVGYSAIHNFVIAPIRMDDSTFGWIVADVDEGDGCPDKRAKTTSLMNASARLLATHAFADERLQQKEHLLLDVVRSLVSAIDAKDPQTCGHSIRVAIYASLVAEGLGLSQQECDELYLAGLLHDVGKIGIPEAIFKKDSSLTEEEFELIKQHPDHGWKILHRLEDLQHILPGVVHHHESLDGTGYPDQIAGDDIPLAARILAAVDAYDALTSERNYRKGKTHNQAMKILDEGAGVQWDPAIVDAIHVQARRMQRVSRKYRREAHPWRIPGSIEPQETESSGARSGVTSRYDAFGIDRI